MDESEEYAKFKKKENSRLGKLSRNVKPFWIVIIGVLIFFGNHLVASGKMTSGVFFGGLFLFGILILFLLFRGEAGQKLIPEHIIKQIALEALENKRKIGIEIPTDAKIRVTLLSGAGYENDMVSGTSGIVKRQVGAEVVRHGKIERWIVSVQPYDGTILDIYPAPMGLNKEALGKDKVIVPVNLLNKPDNI